MLRQVESYLMDTGMAGVVSAWAVVKRRPKQYRRKVDTATRRSSVGPHSRPDVTHNGTYIIDAKWRMES